MHWTKDKPDRPGWWWIKTRGSQSEIVQLCETGIGPLAIFYSGDDTFSDVISDPYIVDADWSSEPIEGPD